MIKKLPAFAFILFFTTQIHLFAQSGSPTLSSGNTTVSTPKNLQYFLVSTKKGSLNGRTQALKTAFNSKPYQSIEVSEIRSVLKISAQKGTTLKDIKAILAGFNINITGCREEYSNSVPSFFINQ